MGIRYMNVAVPPEGHLYIIRDNEVIRHYINLNPYSVQYPIDYDPSRDVVAVATKNRRVKVLHAPVWMTQQQELEVVVKNIVQWRR